MHDLPQQSPSKSSLRKQALLWREQLPIQEISTRICAHLAVWPGFQQAKQVLFYHPFRNEVDLQPLCREYPQKEWYLPTVTSAHEMLFKRINCDLALDTGFYGIQEPPADAEVWAGPCVDTLILIPGLLFDEQGYRLGYGKGYYDRFLSLPHVQSSGCHKVGVVPTALIHSTLAHDPWDVPMNFLVSEDGVKATGLSALPPVEP